MRVIAGKARHLALKTIEGMDTRPTTDRIKETLFNMINNDIYNCRFLDIFAGSGAIGIEALSRGAKEAVFIEKNHKACDCIKSNLIFTKLIENAIIYRCDYGEAINKLKDKGCFDIVFMDPPYNNMFEKDVLVKLKEKGIVSPDSLIIIEASIETDFSYLDELGYSLIKEKKYKSNKHIFVSPKAKEE